jgi:RimJ/RimL family protein N-acetyltransferase
MAQFTDITDAQSYSAALLIGDKARFRPTTDEDLPVLSEWWADPRWAVLQQSTIRPMPATAIEAMFRQWSANTDPNSVGFSIEGLSGEGLVGHITLYGAMIPERAATLAVIVGPDHVGHGYGSDAVRTMVRYGFLQMGLNRIELRTWAFNSRGIRVYAKAGFTEEGRLRDAVFYDGDFHDQVIMSILQREWSRA